jgi:hypothetical protein
MRCVQCTHGSLLCVSPTSIQTCVNILTIRTCKVNGESRDDSYTSRIGERHQDLADLHVRTHSGITTWKQELDLGDISGKTAKNIPSDTNAGLRQKQMVPMVRGSGNTTDLVWRGTSLKLQSGCHLSRPHIFNIFPSPSRLVPGECLEYTTTASFQICPSFFDTMLYSPATESIAQ